MKIYCSGIGGIGLSSYAALQNAAGHTVLGSDRAHSALLKDLARQGMAVFLEQDGLHMPSDIDLFVYSEAIPKDAPERDRATKLGVRQLSYFQALGELSAQHYVIAVCGTHGKSSTVAMAARVFLELKVDATIQVGTKLQELQGRNWNAGAGNIFLVEACEYRKSFQHLSPNCILMTNVDGDHFDAYENIEAYQKAFQEFIGQLPDDGVLITHMNDADCASVAAHATAPVVNADTQPYIELATPGRHMQENAQLVLCLAQHLGLDLEKTQQALAGYAGSWRRLEHKGMFRNDVLVIDDYGHHPKEVRATLSALKEKYPDRKLLCVFQPHTHNRTLQFYQEFIQAFADADEVLLTTIYEARADIEQEKVDVQKFAKNIEEQSNVPCSFGGDIPQVYELLQTDKVQEGSLLLCLGAGTITELADMLIAN